MDAVDNLYDRYVKDDKSVFGDKAGINPSSGDLKNSRIDGCSFTICTMGVKDDKRVFG